MRRLRAWLLRFCGLFARTSRERELAAELESHLALHIEDNLRAGMHFEEARRQALLKLGGIEPTKEMVRERRTLPLLDTLQQDVRFALRILRKNPGFASVAVLTLALGIGANTAIFSIVNAVILRPLPYKDSGRMVVLHTKTAMFPRFTVGLSWPAFQEIRKQAQSLQQTSAYWQMNRTLTGTAQPALLSVASVSSKFFEQLGARPRLGRLLSDEDYRAGPAPVAVISDALWLAQFAKDPAIVGRSFALDKQLYTIVGVAQKEFAFPERAEVWIPLSLTPEEQNNSTFFALAVLGTLNQAANFETLQTELATIAARLEVELNKQKPDLRGSYRLLAETLLDSRVQNTRKGFFILLAATTLVLLIACANLISLLLARGWARQREMCLRTALGASPARLRRQALVESCILALLGGLLGIGVAVGGIQVFRVIAPPNTARLNEISVDATLLWFALISSLLSGVVVGLLPARRAARVSPGEALKEGSTGYLSGSLPFGGALVASEVALAFVLLMGSTLMIQTLAHLLRQNPGFRTDHLLTFDLPQASKWSEQISSSRASAQIVSLKTMLSEVRRVPGVEDVVASDHGMLNGMIFSHAGIKLEGVPPEKMNVLEGLAGRYLSPGYFRMLGIAILRGREFDERDSQSSQKVILVNEAMARKFWGTLDVVGKHVSISKAADGRPEWNEIIGVAANARDISIDVDPDPEYFLALFQWGVPSHHLMVRTRANPENLADTISRQIWSSFPDQPVTHVATLTRTITESVGDQRMHAVLFGTFAAIGLTLALLGVYGVVSYSVARRTQEIGIRVTLGAARTDVLRMVLRQGLIPICTGAAIGVAGSLGVTRLIATELYGVKPGDPATFVAVSALTLFVGTLACWLPARRAMRVDPMLALRHE